MSDELVKADTVRTIKLGGKEYTLSPINWLVLSGIETELGKGVDHLNALLKAQPFTTTLTLAWVFLRDKNPGLTRDMLGQVQSTDEMTSIGNVIGEVIADYFKGEN